MTDDHKTALAPIEPAELTERGQMHPLVQLAVSAGQLPDPDVLRELLAVQREWEAGEARKAYVRDLARVKAELPAVVSHDSKHAQKGFTYASLPAILSAVTEPLAKYGFSLGGDVGSQDKATVTVTVSLTHHLGHSESVTLAAEPDRGAKSRQTGQSIRSEVDAIGATLTRLRRHATMQLLGLASAEDKAPDPETVDTDETLRVFGGMAQKYGLTRAAAEKWMDDKPLHMWTVGDLERLREWRPEVDDG
jgi:hypothetical protein